MSVDKVKEFFNEVEKNKSLKSKLIALDEKSKTSVEAALADLVQVASEEGYQFSEEDYQNTRNTNPEEEDEAPGNSDAKYSRTRRTVVPYDCTAATAWKGHPPDPGGCAIAWGCGVQHQLYGGPHIPKCTTRPV